MLLLSWTFPQDQPVTMAFTVGLGIRPASGISQGVQHPLVCVVHADMMTPAAVIMIIPANVTAAVVLPSCARGDWNLQMQKQSEQASQCRGDHNNMCRTADLERHSVSHAVNDCTSGRVWAVVSRLAGSGNWHESCPCAAQHVAAT